LTKLDRYSIIPSSIESVAGYWFHALRPKKRKEDKMRKKAQFTAKEENCVVKEYDKEHKRHLFDPGDYDPIPACVCGWNGEVDWRAKGQRCPRCGLDLT
jgi:hypothetical protein